MDAPRDAERDFPPIELPLFPLHTALCPGICLPLHIFEPRYRQMVSECLATGTSFGIVLIRDGRESGHGQVAIARVGTIAEIRKASRYEDGRFDILVVGTRRFVLDDVVTDTQPYLVGRVTPLPDTVGDDRRANLLSARVSRRFVEYLDLLRPRDGEDAEELEVRVEVNVESEDADDAEDAGREMDDAATGDGAKSRRSPGRVALSSDPSVLSHLLCGIIQVEHARRQELLEAPSAEARLRALDRLLDREIRLLKRRLRHYSPDPGGSSARRN